MNTEIHNAKFLFFGVRTIDMQLKLYCFEKERKKKYALLCALALYNVASVFDIFSLYVRYFSSSFHYYHRFSVQLEECMSFFFIFWLTVVTFRHH